MKDFTGRWRANLEKSVFLSMAPIAVFIQIDHAEHRIREEVCSTLPDGTENLVVFACSATGEEGQSTLNGEPIRGSAHWDRDELIIESWIRLAGRELYFRDCWELSEDGRTLSMEHREDALNGQLTVLEKCDE